jgi:DNA (cytosine-5)-methyltransferase 1
MLKFVDLFCGIGGFRLALERHNLRCVFSSDIDENIRTVYKKNFGDLPQGDITKINEKKIPKHDILCAGFPCQSFSISGKKTGMQDKRGQLFYEIVRIANYHRPSILLLENVKNITSIANGGAIKTIVSSLDKIGYQVEMSILNASDFGIPQARKRVYFVCFKKTILKAFIKYNPPSPSYDQIFLEDILESRVSKSLYINRSDVKLSEIKEENNSLRPIRIGLLGKGGQGERIYSPKGHAVTLSAFGGGVGAKTGLYKDKKGIRRLSILEAKRIMGFPDNHHISKGLKGYTQLGNAVIPTMVDHFYCSLKGFFNEQ